MTPLVPMQQVVLQDVLITLVDTNFQGAESLSAEEKHRK
jgi:hypothetical protein